MSLILVYVAMDATLKKQPTEVLRIEDADHVLRMIHLERPNETTLRSINMNRSHHFVQFQNKLKLIQVEFKFCHFKKVDEK